MARIMRQHERFTHDEWKYSNNIKYRGAELERQNAESVQNESDRLIDETAKRTQRTLDDVNKKIDQRVKDIKYWKSELDKKIDDIDKENATQLINLKSLKMAFDATEEPLHVANQCIQVRNGRKGIELVHDDAQKCLIKEAEVIKGVQALLHKTIEQANEQIRLNKKMLYNLRKDSSTKQTSNDIEEYILTLQSTDESLPSSFSLPTVNANSVAPNEWQAHCLKLIEEGDKQLQNSQQLQSIVNGILQQIAADQMRAIQATNRALQERISEVKSAKGKLEEHLALVLKEISKVEDAIVDIQNAIADKDGSLRLAGTRIGLRNERPGIELCRDAPSHRLIQEVHEITRDVAKLREQLNVAQESLKALCRRQLELEEEIQLKSSTIFIDEVQCMLMRQSISIIHQ